MSVSSGGEGGGYPVLHALYDQRRVSEEGTVDSFVIRDIRARRDRARHGEPEAETGFFSSLVSNMRTCCAPSSRKAGGAYGMAHGDPTAAAARAAGGGGGAAGGVGEGGGGKEKVWTVAGELFGGRRVKTFTSGSSSSSSSSSASSSAAAGGRGKRAGGGGEEEEGQAGGWVGRNNNQKLTGEAAAGGSSSSSKAAGMLLWRITDPGSAALDLTPEQAAWAAVVWCMRLEYSEHMSVRMLNEILQGAAQQKRDVDLAFALQHTPQFQLLVLVRRASGRRLEDLFGDYAAVLSQTCPAAAGVASGDEEEKDKPPAGPGMATASASTYLILTRERVLATYVRQQGEFLDIGIFDPRPSSSDAFPPSFCGFQTVEAMQAYALNAYATDPREKKSDKDKFQAYILTSKHSFAVSPHARDYSTKRPAGRDDWMATEALTTKDPRFEAKVMYTNMYRATDTPLADENIFSMEPGSGMQIQEKKDMEANKTLMEEEGRERSQTKFRNR